MATQQAIAGRLEFKDNGLTGGLYRIDCRGPWRNEYKTDSLLSNGVYEVVEGGKVVGLWSQTTTGHYRFTAE